jgi:hypothetical protein
MTKAVVENAISAATSSGALSAMLKGESMKK